MEVYRLGVKLEPTEELRGGNRTLRWSLLGRWGWWHVAANEWSCFGVSYYAAWWILIGLTGVSRFAPAWDRIWIRCGEGSIRCGTGCVARAVALGRPVACSAWAGRLASGGGMTAGQCVAQLCGARCGWQGPGSGTWHAAWQHVEAGSGGVHATVAMSGRGLSVFSTGNAPRGVPRDAFYGG